MYEIARMRHGVENMLISDLVAENESNVQIAHKPFLSKLLTKGIHWDLKSRKLFRIGLVYSRKEVEPVQTNPGTPYTGGGVDI